MTAYHTILRYEEVISDCFLVLTRMREAQRRVRPGSSLESELSGLCGRTVSQVRETLTSALGDLAPTVDALLAYLAGRVEEWRSDLDGDSCSACGRALAIQEAQRVQCGEELVPCPGCSRILVESGQASPPGVTAAQ